MNDNTQHDSLRARAVELREGGATIREIAKRLKTSENTVKYWLARYRRLGPGSLVKYARCNDNDNENLHSALEECSRSPAPITVIARKYQVKYNTLYTSLRKNCEMMMKRKAILEQTIPHKPQQT